LSTVTRNLCSVAVIAVIGVVSVAACGSDGDAGESSVTSSDTTASPTGESSADVFADAPDGWCAAARSIREAGSALDLIDASVPAQVEAVVGQLVDRLDEAATIAPDRIADSVAVTAGSARDFQAALAEVGFEVARADLSSILGPANETATRAIDAYNAEACGFAPAAPTGTADTGTSNGGGVVFDPADGPIRDQAIEFLVGEGFTEDQAACLFDAFDLTDAGSLSDPEVEAELLDRCEVDPSQLPGADG
jgi:hypothetical protein